MMGLRTEREIIRINNYEDKWKIKTNINKFTPIALGHRREEIIRINNNNEINFETQGKSLGLKITRNGYYSHVTERKAQATAALKKLKRFSQLPSKIKTHLVKAMVLPILDYPLYQLTP